MIEVRSSYMVKMKDRTKATELWREARDSIWPILDWQGRIQQMLHGHAQQSLFVWSSEWESMSAWEEGMARTLGCEEYKDWAREINKVRVYGGEREVFEILDPALPADGTAGKVEVRSAYIVQIPNRKVAKALLQRGQESIWPLMNWSGQNQQMLHGKASQSMFLWSSVWDDLAAWERAMDSTIGHTEFVSWWREFLEIADFGGPREVFRNL